MVLYEVNLTVANTIAEDYRLWLAEHIQEMLEFDGFVTAQWFESEEGDSTEHTSWIIHYYLRDRDALQDYFDNHAGRMRQDGLDRFGNNFSATRRIFSLRESFRK